MPSQDFIEQADYILGEIKAYLPENYRNDADYTRYEILDTAEPVHKMMTGTPLDWNLLGMYEESPTPKITLFEQSVRSAAGMFGNVVNSIRSVLEHELWQHRFGFDHTKETYDLGLIPAYAVSPHGVKHEPWKKACSCGCDSCGG